MPIENPVTLLNALIPGDLSTNLATFIAVALIVLGGAAISLFPRTFLTPGDRDRRHQTVRLDDSEQEAPEHQIDQDDVAHRRKQRLTNAIRDERA